MNADLFTELVEGVREGGAILRGERRPSRAFEIESPDVKQIRAGYRLSQRDFAALLHISIGTLRNWEQGRRKPEGPARVLLQIAATRPDALLDVVRPHPDGDHLESRNQQRSTGPLASADPSRSKKRATV